MVGALAFVIVSVTVFDRWLFKFTTTIERDAVLEISLAASVNESSPSETNVVAWLMPLTRTLALDAKFAPITRTFTGCVPTGTFDGSSDAMCGSFGRTENVTAVDAVEPGFVAV